MRKRIVGWLAMIVALGILIFDNSADKHIYFLIFQLWAITYHIWADVDDLERKVK